MDSYKMIIFSLSRRFFFTLFKVHNTENEIYAKGLL